MADTDYFGKDKLKHFIACFIISIMLLGQLYARSITTVRNMVITGVGGIFSLILLVLFLEVLYGIFFGSDY